MANIERGEVEVVVDGTPYTLKLSMNAAVKLESKLKKRIGEILAEASALDFTAIREIVWVLLQKYHGDTFKTPDAVGDFIDNAGGVKVFFETLQRLGEANNPDGAGGNPQQAPTSGTGGGSTETLAVSA